jgi:ankyrin repeat protein
MSTRQANEPIAAEVVRAIEEGAADRLRDLLAAHADLATTRIVAANGAQRTLLHIATDWPGHRANVAETIGLLIAAGADVNGRFVGKHTETPLHWAASCDDVVALDALLDAGADIEARGAVIGGGTALDDAVAFAQWNAARRLVARGALPSLWNASALGLLAQVEESFAGGAAPPAREITNAFWCACHGGQRITAEYLLDRGADLNWIGHDHLTPLDAARRSNADDVVAWLLGRGARSKDEVR